MAGHAKRQSSFRVKSLHLKILTYIMKKYQERTRRSEENDETGRKTQKGIKDPKGLKSVKETGKDEHVVTRCFSVRWMLGASRWLWIRPTN